MPIIAVVVYCLPEPTCDTSRNSPASIRRSNSCRMLLYGVSPMPRAKAVSRIARAVVHSQSLEDMIACPCHSTLCLNRRLLHLVLAVFVGKGHDAVGLVSILCGQLAVPL